MIKQYWLRPTILSALMACLCGWSTAQTARVQIIHNAADPAAATVDVYVGATRALDNFAFRTATPYIDLPAGSPIELVVQPSTSTDTANALYRAVVTLDADSTYTVIANGVLNPASFASNPNGRSTAFNLYALTGGQESSPTAGQPSLRVWHGASDAPTVGVDARGVGTLVPAATYLDGTGYLQVPANTYTLDITAGGSTVASFTAPLTGFGDSALVVLASGFLNPSANQNGPAFGLLAVTAQGNAILLPTAVSNKPLFGSEVSVFPNPAAAQLTIAGASLGAGAVATLVATDGREVLSQPLPSSQQISIDRSTVKPGLYHLRVASGSQLLLQRAVVLQ